MKVLIYALGGGWGHLTRATALAHALQPLGARILTNSPYAGIVQAAMPELAMEPVSTREQAVSLIADSNPDVLVVDTFPRGLGGELTSLLPQCRARKILVHRDLAPAYVAWAGNLREFVATQYNLILCPGEAGPFSDLPNAVKTSAWIVRAPKEVHPPAPQAIVCASGNQDEQAWYGEASALLLARGVDTRCLASELPLGCPPQLWVRVWPAIDWIAAARVVIGGAGYNTVNECIATGTPLVAHPWPRKYDRQRERAERNPRLVRIVETPIEAVNAALEVLAQPRPARPEFSNGACEAAQRIAALLT